MRDLFIGWWLTHYSLLEWNWYNILNSCFNSRLLLVNLLQFLSFIGFSFSISLTCCKLRSDHATSLPKIFCSYSILRRLWLWLLKFLASVLSCNPFSVVGIFCRFNLTSTYYFLCSFKLNSAFINYSVFTTLHALFNSHSCIMRLKTVCHFRDEENG